MDDLLLETSNDGYVFAQATTRLTRSTNSNSKLASALEQCVRQFHKGSPEVGGKSRPLDARDRLVIVTDADAPVWLRGSLPSLLRRFRQETSFSTLAEASLSDEDRTTAAAIEENINRSWFAVTEATLSPQERRGLLELLRFEVLSLEPEGSDRLAAVEILRQAVLADPTSAESAFDLLIQYCATLAADHAVATRPQLKMYLEKQPQPLRIRGPLSFEDDFASIQTVTSESMAQLFDLSVTRVNSVSDPVKIARNVVHDLESATQSDEGHCLIVGEPGAGKSGALHEFAHSLVAAGNKVIYMAADRIAATNERQLKVEWGLKHSLLEVIANVPITGSAYLIIDALDAARSEESAKLLRELISYVIGSHSNWRVVASIRKFDLRYGHTLQDLFRGPPATASGFDPEFSQVRHVNVLPLGDSELDQAAAQSTELNALLSSARALPDGSLLALLRNPFNLRLAASLLGSASSIEDLSAVRTQIELLERYWRERVIAGDGGSHAREQVSRLMCERMATAGRLQAFATEIPGTDSKALHELKQAGIVIEWQVHSHAAPDRYILAFAHNVLFDYACSRLLMRLPSTAVIDLIVNQRRTVLTLQPSFTLHFQYLWHLNEDRVAFWKSVLAMQTTQIPSIGQLTGLSVCASNAISVADLDGLSNSLSEGGNARKLAERAVQHLAGALLSSFEPIELVGANAGPWCEWVRDVSGHLTLNIAPAVRVLVNVISDVSESLTREQHRYVNEAACNVFDFAQHDDRRQQQYLPSAVPALCRTLSANEVDSSSRLRQLFDEAEIEKGRLIGLTYFSYEIQSVFPVAPQLAADFYVSIFTANEPPDAKVPIGDSQLFSLLSSVRQNFQGIKYQLGEKYEAFLRANLSVAIKTLCAVIGGYVLDRRSYTERNGKKHFVVGEETATLISDYSSSWDDGDLHQYDAPIKMLAALDKYLEELVAKDGAEYEFSQILGLFVAHNQYAVVWRRLLRFGARYPESLGRMLLPVAEADVVLLSSETRVQAVDLLRGVFPKLDAPARERIERKIIDLPSSSHAWSVEYATRTRDQVLACLPVDALTTDGAIHRWREMEAANEFPANRPDFERSFSWRSLTEEDMLDDQERRGIPARDPSNLELRRRWAAAAEFANRFANSIPGDEDVNEVWPQIIELQAAITRADSEGVHSDVKNQAIGYLANACGCLATSEAVVRNNERAIFLKQCLLDASINETPVYDEERDSQFERMQSWSSSSPRIEAAEGLMILCRRPELLDKPLLEAIARLISDRVSAVRFGVVRRLLNLFDSDPATFWIQAEKVSVEEKSDPILSDLLDHVLRPLPAEELDRAVALAERVFSRLEPTKEDHEARQSCVYFFLHKYVQNNHLRCKVVLEAIIDDPIRNHPELGRMVGSLREPLGAGIRGALSSEQQDISKRAWAVASRVTTSTVDAFATARADMEKPQNSEDDGESRANATELYGTLFHLLDYLSTDLYFASGVYDDEQAKAKNEPLPTVPEGREDFLTHAEPLIRLLMSTGLVPVAHHLLQFLAAYVDVDPARVFTLIGEIIVAAEQQGYQNESLGAGLVVEVVERYLAEFRHVFRDHPESQELLIRVLDIFVGWPRARRLVYRLGDIYR